MRRIHAFELEDQSWFPSVLRDAGMAYLRAAADWTGQAAHMRPVIAQALDRAGEDRIVDLCSGGGGPVVSIARELRAAGRDVQVTLTDLYPSPGARAEVASSGEPGLEYEASSVDATAVGADRPGLRTLFNAFHHFRPATAEAILRSAVSSGHGIAVVEVLQRRWLALLGLLGAPLIVLLALPFLRPFRWPWLVLTYVVPIIPLFIWWDGTVSVLRIYSREELLAMARRADPEGAFEWEVREIPMAPSPLPGIALLGTPIAARAGA
jgi:hypothetical protein